MHDNAYGPDGRRRNFKDMSGARVGHLVVVREAFNVSGKPRWLCRCDCGGDYVVEGFHLRAALRRGSSTYSCPACRRRRQQEVRRARARRRT